ncbi:MAG: cobyric acid synthase [Gudongella sp.]|nr:cobyric acid synthase [Gudongella sp.]
MSRIMIQGTTSSAGKSMTAMALCRIFSKDGYNVYPFKSQNMSREYSFTTDGKMISVAQAIQAVAAGKKPQVNMNPILLVPDTNTGSRVFVHGQEMGLMEAREYFQYRKTLKKSIMETYEKIQNDNDIVVIEGAGSPAEINLRQDDIVNMGMAEMADAPVLLVTDIDRGGAFAALYGTVMLLEPHERNRIKGMIINKFRGDKTLLDPGIEMIQEKLGIPVVGVVPYTTIDIADEDSIIEGKEKSEFDIEDIERLESEIERFSQVVRDSLHMDYIYSLVGVNNG